MTEEIRNIIRLDQPVGPKPEVSLPKPEVGQPAFGDIMKNLIGDVDRLQKTTEAATGKMLTGELEDVHQVVVAMEEAQASFRLLMEVRNKMVEAYKEVMRMQV